MILQDYNHDAMLKKITDQWDANSDDPWVIKQLGRIPKEYVDISCMKGFVHGFFENPVELLEDKLCEVRTQMIYDADNFDGHQFKCELLKFIRDKQIRTIYLWRVSLWDMAEDGIKLGKGKHIIAISYYATHYMVKCKENTK